MILPSDYAPPTLLRWKHSATIVPNRLRPIPTIYERRLTIETEDDDFFDVDAIDRDAGRVAILLHGLEGSSASTYMRGMARAFADRDWTVYAMNHRGCSGRMNRTVGSYHSGFTQDLKTLIGTLDQASSIVVVGFSLGGNIALKYAGEDQPPENVKAIVGISVPVHLASSAKTLSRWYNTVYLRRFLKQLKRKALLKAETFPEAGLHASAIRSAHDFLGFDDAYTAPAHGFASAQDYYARSSAIGFLSSIHTPTLLINALNDSFLAPECYPSEQAERNEYLRLMMPPYGGHVGFASDLPMRKEFWHERKVIEFIRTFAA